MTPAEWMDRLSDRLGSFIPGDSRWPPRHPVKVSLVMGVLGMAAGWMIFGSWNFGIDVHGNMDWRIQLPSSAISGVLILLPLLLWNRNRWTISCCGILVAMLSRYVAEEIHHSFQPYSTNIERWSYQGLEDGTVALFHAGWVAGTIRRNSRWMFGLTMASGALCGPALLCAWDLNQNSSPWLVEELTFAAPWVGFYCALAICLGIALWDTTPRSKFEPAEPS